MKGISPFRIDIGDDRIADILFRVRAFPWEDMPAGQGASDGWGMGTDIGFMRELCRHWTTRFDWKAAEAKLNRFPQYRATVDGIDLHFYMEPGSGPDPIPLLLLHGWPGSVFEFQELIGPLAHPERYGGTGPAYTVILPSLPGFGFSGRLTAPIAPRQAARLFDALMCDVLGFPSYLAQGGDWGAVIAGWLGHEGRGCGAIHLNLMGWHAPGAAPRTEAEVAHFESVAQLRRQEGGYQDIMRTKPQTLSFAMMDSPVGLCAWLVEKFHGWSDRRSGFGQVFSHDQLLTNVMIYLVTNSFGTASWIYHARAHEERLGPKVPEGARIAKPVGIANFPFEFLPFPPRSYVERSMNVVHWTDMDRGGHFAALECPDLMIEDLRTFGSLLRRQGLLRRMPGG